jgi:hypothetical protein
MTTDTAPSDALAAYIAEFGSEPLRYDDAADEQIQIDSFAWVGWTERKRAFLAAYSSRQAVIDAQAAEIEQLNLAEEGAKEAFGALVEQKRDLEAECKKLQGLLDSAHSIIRKQAVENVPFAWQYTVNGAHTLFSDVCPPDDAYDEGTLIPLYRAILAAEPAKDQTKGGSDEA